MNDERKSREQLIAELRDLRQRLAQVPGGVSTPLDGDDVATQQRRILENLRAMMAEVDDQGRMIYVSPTVTDLLGYQPEEILQQPGFEWIHPDDTPQLADLMMRAIASGQSSRTVYRARHRDGHWLWLESTGSVIRGSDGRARFVALTRDITELKRAGDALRDSEDRFRTMAENASDLLVEVDDRGRILFVSPNCRRLLGLDPDSLIGDDPRRTQLLERIHWDDRERVVRELGDTLRPGDGVGEIEFRIRRGDGSWCWLHCAARSYRRSDGRRSIVIARDVTERRRVADELRESEERYRLVTEATSDLVTEFDAEGRLVYASHTCKTVLGFAPEELVGTTPMALLCHPDDLERLVDGFLQGLDSKGPTRMEAYRMRHRDGSWRWFEGVGIPYHRADGEARMIGISRDVTERVRAEEEKHALEERMRQAQKLEGLGVLAGGIAHDFNNLLTPILGDASLALMDAPNDSPVRERLTKIQKAAHRAAGLTHQLLAYAGKGPLLVESVNVSQLVLEMAQLLESAISRKAVLAYEMAAHVPWVDGDPTQLSQVVMNLITNASEAIGCSGGRIAVRTGVVEADRVSGGETLFGDELGEGPYVYFEVEDNGAGMDEVTRSRIFDPFFTTKFAGRGLGLAAVLGIVRSHRGALELESEPGRGTRFRVLLPASRSLRDAPPAERSRRTDYRTDATALVVDDDAGVRDLAAETLRRAGLTVITAADGTEALALFERRAHEIDIVVLDRTMPNTTGEEAFEAMRRIRPDARILLVSGYSQTRASEHLDARGLAGFLQKPFLPEALLEKVRETLERG